MTAPSARQLAFLDELMDLVGVSRLQVGDVVTAADASAAIDRLLDLRDGGAPLRHATRSAVFAGLKETSFTKEDLYAAVGISTLADGACERDGRRCLVWLQQQRVEVVRPAQKPPRTAEGYRIIPGRAVVRPAPPPPTQAPSPVARPPFVAGGRTRLPPRQPRCTPEFIRVFGLEAARPWVPHLA